MGDLQREESKEERRGVFVEKSKVRKEEGRGIEIGKLGFENKEMGLWVLRLLSSKKKDREMYWVC